MSMTKLHAMGGHVRRQFYIIIGRKYARRCPNTAVAKGIILKLNMKKCESSIKKFDGRIEEITKIHRNGKNNFDYSSLKEKYVISEDYINFNVFEVHVRDLLRCGLRNTPEFTAGTRCGKRKPVYLCVPLSAFSSNVHI